MQYYSFSQELKKHKMYIFSLRDLENLFPKEKLKTLKNNLSRWASKGRITRLKRDLYELTELDSDLKIPDLYIANRLYHPSYVSLETALSFYSIIPGVAVNVTSVTTRPTRTFKNKYGQFFYRSCQKKAFCGYYLMRYEGTKIYMADKEKALVDFLYYRLRSGRPLNLKEERLNEETLKELNWTKALKYAKIYNKRVVKTIKEIKC